MSYSTVYTRHFRPSSMRTANSTSARLRHTSTGSPERLAWVVVTLSTRVELLMTNVYRIRPPHRFRAHGGPARGQIRRSDLAQPIASPRRRDWRTIDARDYPKLYQRLRRRRRRGPCPSTELLQIAHGHHGAVRALSRHCAGVADPYRGV
ncbi:hypothetical protein BC938DRAFT_482184 [Jimgerdemannia flammicorona]|uniref:Uncharacterized protein n=1 Tax=Jimgerdemannia flammicorona TaxID=994334 RepID=A0A433QEE0_9FUNG|nr:hypothetical protein BC938DRAFT_482184 [Jimgerdemannia flammicorona]